MKRRFVLAALPAALITLTGATKPKKKAAPAPAPAPLTDIVRVEFVTELGTITADLFHKQAPITVQNFMRYVDGRRFDGMAFYRAMKLNWGIQPNGIIQTGLRGLSTKVFPPIAHEPTSVTGIKHLAGTLSMARNAPGTAQADFSILMSDLSGFDADPAAADPELKAGYAAFGRVVSGMDLVRAIQSRRADGPASDPYVEGQMLNPPVAIIAARRQP